MESKTDLTENGGRLNNGRFGKGNKFSKGARPLPEDFKKVAEEHSLEALMGIIEDMRNPELDPQLRFKCRELIMAYGVGKPKQNLDIESNNKTDNVITIKLEGDLEKWSR